MRVDLPRERGRNCFPHLLTPVHSWWYFGLLRTPAGALVLMKPSDVSEKRSEEGSSVSDAPSSSQFTEYLNVRPASQGSVLRIGQELSCCLP